MPNLENTFFSSSAPKKRHIVDVGAKGDCGFRAIAAGLIDTILTSPNINKDVLIRLLDAHSKYYPSTSSDRLQTPVERLRKMVASPALMATTIEQFAFTLRQIAVDEWFANPSIYRGAFISEHEGTAPSKMRKSGTWIDENAIAAIANTLNIPITVRLISAGKEIPAKFVYGKEARSDEVVIQLQKQHYTVAVRQPDRFIKAVGAISSQEAAPLNNSLPVNVDPDIAEIIQRIKNDDQRLVDNFEKNDKRLRKMLESGELNKDDLLAIYIAGMKESDYLQGRIKYVGIDHGHKDFFQAAIDNAARSSSLPNNSSDKGYEQEITNELVHAIARAISIGHLNESLLNERFDNGKRFGA